MRDDVIFLIVDDDEIDRIFIRRAFRKYGITNRIEEAEDGTTGIARLHSLIANCTPKQPIVVLLDIKMPLRDGFDFLEEVRQSPDLQGIIVFVLTSSNAPSDVARAYAHNVAGYIVKGQRDADKTLADLLRSYCKLVEFPD